MEMSDYRNTGREQARIADLMSMVPPNLDSVIDVGARDGYLSLRLAELIPRVTALDLQLPRIDDPRIHCVQGDASALAFADAEVDVVFCAEVLEHIPSPVLEQVCAEFSRVARAYLIIGVPYKQDIRHARTTCQHCGAVNPPWGHVNSFDEHKLQALFPDFKIAKISLIETAEKGTNALSAALYNFSGNPYGTYSQDEGCIACGQAMQPPRHRSVLQRVATRAAYLLREALIGFEPAHANWVHILFERKVKLAARPAAPARQARQPERAAQS